MALRLKCPSKLALAGVAAATVATSWIGVGAAAAGPLDPTSGGSAASTTVVPSSDGEHFYTAYLIGDGPRIEYAWDVFSNGTATSSVVPSNGFVGSWTWTATGKHVTFQETNGAGCTWYAKKTPSGYNSAAHRKLALCSGNHFTWYAVRGGPG